MPADQRCWQHAKVREEVDVNESNTGLVKEVSSSKVALYPYSCCPLCR
jgi:hypothetical protein